MIGDGLHEDVLRHLVQQHAVHEVLVTRVEGGPSWGLSIRLGGSGACWGAFAAGKTAHLGEFERGGKFADAMGLKGFNVEL